MASALIPFLFSPPSLSSCATFRRALTSVPFAHIPTIGAGDILHLLFRLRNQRLVEDYSCAISESMLLHGRMVS